jgi:hypothetical protein
MSTYRKSVRQAIHRQKAARLFDPRLAGLALALSIAVCALLVDRDGVLGGLREVGQVLEDGARLIASVDMPFG